MTMLRIRRGDTWERTFTVTQGGEPLDLAGIEQAWLTFREQWAPPAEADDTAAPLQITLGAGITVADGPNGVLQLVLTPAQTKLLIRNSYEWDLQFRLLDGRIKTPDSGRAAIESDVTVSI